MKEEVNSTIMDLGCAEIGCKVESQLRWNVLEKSKKYLTRRSIFENIWSPSLSLFRFQGAVTFKKNNWMEVDAFLLDSKNVVLIEAQRQITFHF